MNSKRKKEKSSDLSKEISIELFLKQDKIILDALKTLIERLKEEHKLSSEEIVNLLTQKSISKELIPISVFNNKELSSLETIVKYLKENIGYNFSKIASLLNRDQRTIWTTYKNSTKKRKEPFTIKEIKYAILVSIFSNRKFAVLELISEYLHDHYNLRFSEIASLLNRDQRTIWTTYQRIRKKRSNVK